MKAGIISDTHDLLRPEVIRKLQGCDCILHAGDISSPVILDNLEKIAPVRVVRGNMDREWAEHLPVYLDFELAGLRIYMTHKRKDLPADLSAYDLVIIGHTHRYESSWLETESRNRTLILNPGSCGPRRFIQPVTMAILSISEDGFNVERIDIPHAKDEPDSKAGTDIRQQIETVVRETQKGRTVPEIAQKYRMEEGLVEQIARLYVTHPGVTADGIMTKMGL